LLTSAVVPLIFFSFFTSLLSGVTGGGGGILLFSLMTFLMPISEIVPIHGIVQFGSNSSRILLLRKYLIKSMQVYFALGAILGVIAAVYLSHYYRLDNRLLLGLIIILISYSLFKPKKMPALEITYPAFFLVGIIAGIIGIFIGTIGPFIAVFFVRNDLSKHEIVANKSIMQWLVHLMKIPAFFSLGFDYIKTIYLWLPMIAIGYIGTHYGVRLLGIIKDSYFRFIFKAALFVALIRLIYKIFNYT